MQPIRIIAILLVCLALSPLAPAQAEPVKEKSFFDVTTISDNGEANPGNCICETIGATSLCSLRAAFEEANACSGNNEIRLNNGVTYTIATPLRVDAASIDPLEKIFLHSDDDNGTKPIIKGTGAEDYTALSVVMGTLDITNLTISDSDGIFVGRMMSGTTMDGRLNLDKVLMIDNWEASAANDDRRYGGGAIQNSMGSVTINNSVFNNNRSILNCGGAINNSGHLVIRNSSFLDNIAPYGGAICHVGFRWPDSPYETWNMEIYNSEFSGNVGSNQGGAIFLSGPSLYGDYNIIEDSFFHDNISYYGSGGAIFAGYTNIDPYGGGFVLRRSTISNNTADYGGGLSLANPGNFQSREVVYIENSTISGNQAEMHGGGIYMGDVPFQAQDADPTVYIHNSTISNNTADSLGSAGGNGGGIYNTATTQAPRLENSILAGNIDGSTGQFALIIPDCLGSINLEGYNIIGRSGGCSLDSDGSSLIGNSSAPIDPLLKPLGQDGYLIPTHGLLQGSPAINGGDPTGCKDILNLIIPLDQRGEPRPYGPVCDIGSVEAQFTVVKKIFLPTILR